MGKPLRSQDYQIASVYNPRANYSNSNFDVRNAFKGYAVYQLPFGRGKQFLNSSRLLDEAVGGWQISGTVVLQTGNPIHRLRKSEHLHAGRHAVSKPESRSRPCTHPIAASYNWFNPAAFTEPANGTFGNVRRNSLYGPGINTFNFSAAKAFTIPWREGIGIQFRADAQNVFNHPSFGQSEQHQPERRCWRWPTLLRHKPPSRR